MFPSFKEFSFLELQFFETVLYDFSIEMEFKATNLNGLIFFMTQVNDNADDFISILLRNGVIEMKFETFFY